MPGLHELNVSLTKNGYFKVADVIAKHPRHEVLDNIRGTYATINLDRAQITNMLSADPITKELPEEWDEIRNYSKRAIDALVFISILFSHHTFITVFAKSRTAEMRGVLHREDLGDKAYTNVVYSMQTLGLCAYIPGADAIDYNLTPLFKELSIGPLVKRILARKLAKTCWKEPGPNDPFTRTFYEQCFHFGFHHTLGVSERQFQDWLEGQAVEVEVPPVLKAPNDIVTVSASLLSALAAKPFVIIAGATGTGKTQTIRSCVKALCPADTEPGFNHVFVPVEAGWTDSRHLLGYRNPFGRMGESYSTTLLLSLLLRANYPAHAMCPFFIILDEMNLSYVEMYFSRFLSLMETSAGGQPEAVLGPSELRLLWRSAPSAIEATYIEHAITSGGLFLSRNVFIVGTVNVDETTHMFSPKVLDRAFVLEFPTMLPSQKPDEFAIASADAAEGHVRDFWHYLVESSTIAPSKEDDAFLDTVYGKLERFRFGPRVTMEAQRYLAAVKALAMTAKCADEFSSATTIRDHALMQKILPKLHGNRSQVGKVVNELLVLAREGGYERARAKLTSMANDLRSPGFTSYFA
jgi:hypothetical protein